MILPVHAAVRTALTDTLATRFSIAPDDQPAIVIDVPPKRALGDSILSDTSSLTDLGMILGAMAAAAASAPYARNPWPPLKSLAAAALGGLLMGWGARLGFGCNIGAFIGGVASGSLHGWIWFAVALPGCMIGIKLRPLFGLSRE